MNKGYFLLDCVIIVVITAFSVLIVSQLVNVKISFNKLKNECYEEIDNYREERISLINPCIEKEDISTSTPSS